MSDGVYKILGGLKVPETSGEMIQRNVLRGAARGLETIVGAPADLVKGVYGLANLGLQKATGGKSPLPQEIPIPMAGSEWYRENITKPLTGEYLEPKGKIEGGIDDLVSDAVSVMMGGVKPSKALLASGLGNIAGWSAEGLGAEKGTKAGLKAGFTILPLVFSPKALTSEMKRLYKSAEESIPAEGKTSIEPLLEQINNTEKKLKYGGSTPIKNEVKNKIEELKGKISEEGKMDVNDVWAFKRDFNELIRKKGGTKELEGIEKDLTPFVNKINETLSNYGKVNKSFKYKDLAAADDIWQGLNVHSRIKRFLMDTVTPKNLIVGGLFGLSHPHVMGKGIAGALGARYGVEAIEPILRSPSIRKYYLKTISSAANKSKIATIRNYRNLEKVVDKEHGVGEKGYKILDLKART